MIATLLYFAKRACSAEEDRVSSRALSEGAMVRGEINAMTMVRQGGKEGEHHAVRPSHPVVPRRDGSTREKIQQRTIVLFENEIESA